MTRKKRQKYWKKRGRKQARELVRFPSWREGRSGRNKLKIEE